MAVFKFPNVADTSGHTFSAKDAAAVTAELVSQDGVLSALISRNYEQDLMQGGGRGRTVNIRIPAALVARERGIDDKSTGITVDEITEGTVPVTLGTHAYSAVSLSEGDLNFKLEDFARQVLSPQATAVSEYLENSVAVAFAAIPETNAAADIPAWDAANPVKQFTAIRKLLRKRGVPQENLNTVVGTNVYAALLDANAITDASASGSTAALRDANVGRVRGFNIVESTRVGDDEILAFHRDAFTLAVRAPLPVLGAESDAISEGGFPLRYLRDYDSTVMGARSIVSTFTGVAALPLFRVTRNYTTNVATVTQVPNGGVVRINTATAPTP